MGTRILVVDDSPIEQRVVGRLLEKALTDVAVAYADNGQQALDALSATPPDLIISDLRMPVMNGLELVQTIKARGLGLPVILMTSFGNEQIAVEALQSGAASYVPKVAINKLLIETVRSVLLLSRGQVLRRRILNTLESVESRFVLENDTCLIAPLVACLQEQMGMMRLFDEMQLTQIGVAVHESLTNAIYHGNLELDSELRQEDESIFYRLATERLQEPRFAARRVRLAATMSAAELRIVISDEGPGFRPTEVRDPTDKINMDRIGGRGLLLIRSFMDEVRHSPRGNEITMVKRAP